MNYLKQIRFYKLVNALSIASALLISLGILFYVGSGRCVEGCSYEFKTGLLDPLYIISNIFFYVLFVFLFLPSHYFRRWLWYVASWALPLLFYFVMSESVYNSGLFSGRDFTAKIGMYILAAISMAFVVGVFAFGQITTYIKKRSHIQ